MATDPPSDINYWRGKIDTSIESSGRTLKRLDDRQDKLDQRQDQFDRELTAMKVKVAAGAAIGSIIGGAIVTFIFAIASKAVGGG
jgi:hypothetical protein